MVFVDPAKVIGQHLSKTIDFEANHSKTQAVTVHRGPRGVLEMGYPPPLETHTFLRIDHFSLV